MEWKPMYDQFMKNPSDYGISAIIALNQNCDSYLEGFKREYAAFRAAEKKKLEVIIDVKQRKKLESMIDTKSKQGKTLLQERIRRKKQNQMVSKQIML